MNVSTVAHLYGIIVLRLPAAKCGKQESVNDIGFPTALMNGTPRLIPQETHGILAQAAGATVVLTTLSTYDNSGAHSQTSSLLYGIALPAHATVRQIIVTTLVLTVSAR